MTAKQCTWLGVGDASSNVLILLVSLQAGYCCEHETAVTAALGPDSFGEPTVVFTSNPASLLNLETKIGQDSSGVNLGLCWSHKAFGIGMR